MLRNEEAGSVLVYQKYTYFTDSSLFSLAVRGSSVLYINASTTHERCLDTLGTSFFRRPPQDFSTEIPPILPLKWTTTKIKEMQQIYLADMR